MTKEDFDAEVYEYAKSRIGTEDSRMTDRMLAYRAGAEPREKQIQIDAEQIRALQKQNGELTDELKDLRESIKDYGAGCYENGLRNGKRKLEKQLTKAKELLERLLITSCNSDVLNLLPNCSEVLRVRVEAEQFISEVEK